MSGKWKRYPAYRESGVEWLGDLPSHWKAVRMKFIAPLQGGFAYKSEDYRDDGIRIVRMNNLRGGHLDFSDAACIPPSASQRGFELTDGDVVLGMSGSVGSFAVVRAQDLPCQLNQRVGRFRTKPNAHRPFVGWVVQTDHFTKALLISGSSTAQLNVSAGDIGRLWITDPPLSEQRSIAAFLDRETAKIDALVAKKERLIELLQEKRTALISHTVTRGLNPNAPLRDSGIPWIGRIPAHWKLKRFRHVTTRVDVGIAEAATHAYADEGVPILRSTNVRANRLLLDDVLRVQPWFAEKNRSKYLLKDDILTVRTGNAGVSAVVPEQLHRSQCFTMLMSTLRKHQDARFYCYFLNASSGQTVFAIEAWGTAQANISVPILKEVPVVEPPYEEQTAIVAVIEHEAAKLDALMAKVRTALISAAVTGQIDVREEKRGVWTG